MPNPRPLYTLHLEAERVESTYDRAEGFAATVAVPLATTEAPDRKPLRIDVRVPASMLASMGEAEIAEAIDSLCASAADREVRAVLSGEAPPTNVDLESLAPKVPHADRAEVFARMVVERRAELEAKHGEDWLRIMLESEFRAVYADGERKGYSIGAAYERRDATIGDWYLNQFAPRVEGLPEPGKPLDARRFTLSERDDV